MLNYTGNYTQRQVPGAEKTGLWEADRGSETHLLLLAVSLQHGANQGCSLFSPSESHFMCP